MDEENFEEAIRDLVIKDLTSTQRSLLNYLISNKDEVLEAFSDENEDW